MFKEFVETGKIERLEELRADFLDRSRKKLCLVLTSKLLREEKEPEPATAKFLMGMFGGMTEHEVHAMSNDWSYGGSNEYDPDVEQA